MDSFFFSTVVPGLLTGTQVTVLVTLSALIIAVILGFVLAIIRHYSVSRVIHFAVDAYVEYFRNIPALSHLFIIYFGLGSLGLRLSSLTAAIAGLGLIGAAITCDIFRSGLGAIPRGHIEAAQAVGFRPFQILRFIVGPQALRVSLPPLGNYSLQLMKDTSIVSAIAAPEIMFNARSMVTSSFESTLIYSTAAGIYLLMSLPLIYGIRRLEQRFGRHADA